MTTETTPFDPSDELAHFVAMLSLENYNALNKAMDDAGGALPKDADGLTLAHHAAAINDTQALRLLLIHGISVDEPDCNGNRPIHLAARNDAIDAFMVLENATCSTTARNLQRESPAQVAREAHAVKVKAHLAAGRRNGFLSRLFVRNQAAAA